MINRERLNSMQFHAWQTADNIFTMKTITWRQCLLIINRSNQIRSDARNHDGRHEQTYRQAGERFISREKRLLATLIFATTITCQTRKALQSWQSLNHTRSVTSTLQLVNRTSRSSMKRRRSLRERASRTVTGHDFRRFQVTAVTSLLSPFFFFTTYFLLHRTTMSLLSSSN